MSNEAVRIAIGLRLGTPICLPHSCSSCGKAVDKLGLHGLSCKSSHGRVSCHQMLNNIIHHSLASANTSSRPEPSGLYRADGNRPDGVTLISWSNGKFLVWDATCVDTFCDFYRYLSAKEAGGAAGHAEKEKSKKYAHLDQCYHFQHIAFETCGAFGPETSCFLLELGRRLKAATGEPNSFTYLLQLSVASQVGNATSVLGYLPNSDFDID